jgi:hypothetical protein
MGHGAMIQQDGAELPILAIGFGARWLVGRFDARYQGVTNHLRSDQSSPQANRSASQAGDAATPTTNAERPNPSLRSILK